MGKACVYDSEVPIGGHRAPPRWLPAPRSFTCCGGRRSRSSSPKEPYSSGSDPGPDAQRLRVNLERLPAKTCTAESSCSFFCRHPAPPLVLSSHPDTEYRNMLGCFPPLTLEHSVPRKLLTFLSLPDSGSPDLSLNIAFPDPSPYFHKIRYMLLLVSSTSPLQPSHF